MVERLNEIKKRKDEFKRNPQLLLNELRSNPQFSNEVKALALHFLYKQPTGCSSCLSDFYIELINLNVDEMKEVNQKQFVIKRGAIFRLNNNTEIYSFSNCTDDKAIERLSQFPEDIKLFGIYPENWEQIVAKKNEQQKQANILRSRQTHRRKKAIDKKRKE